MLRLRTIVALLVLVTTVPLGLFAARLIWTSWQQQQVLVDRQNLESARAISVAVDLEVERAIAALHVLAALDPIDSPDRTQFTEIATRMIPHHPGWESVRLVDRSRRVLANTAAAPGEPSTLLNDDWVRAVIETQRPAVSTLRQDPQSGHWIVAIGIPVMRGSRLTYVLGVRMYASAFSEILARQRVPPDGVVTLLDPGQLIVARTRNEDLYIGGPPTADFAARSRSAQEGTWRTVLLEGTQAYSAWSRSSLTGWTIGIGLPSETVDAPIRRSFGALSAAGLGILGAGLVLALLLSRGIVQAQTAAAAAAKSLARGGSAEPFRSHIAEADDLSRALRDAAAILQTRMQERDQAQREADRHRTALLEREQAARRSAEALNRAKDEFIATVSHELRTPLNAIFGWVAMLRTGSLDAARQAHALEVIDRNTRAQARLIEDLLDMSRMIRGTVRLEMRPVHLGAVLDAAVDSLNPTADARQIAMSVPDGPANVVVSADYSRLQQVIWNLLSNSLKFTPPGGRIEARIETTADEAIVRIADNGEGIAPEFLPHVFDRFRQEVADVTREYSGLGLGLSLVRHLTELHGGTITAESGGKGQGATFTVRLPLLGARASHPPDAPPAVHLPGSGARLLEGLQVLVVDDDEDTRDLVMTALRHAGAQVTSATAVAEALVAFEASPFDLVVSDIAMPTGSGYDLVGAIRAHARRSMVPVVAITAYGRTEDREQALASGFDAHIGKPFDPRALVGILAGLVR